MSKKIHIIPIYVPHKGCPHDCVFCNQKKITGLSTDLTVEDVEQAIKASLKTIPNTNEHLEVAFYGGSFTAIELNIQESLLRVAYKYKKEGFVDVIRISTRPDYIDNERVNLLKKYEVDIIEIGVQSMDEDVLKSSHRGHSSEHVLNAVQIIKKHSITLGLQMMIGLPGDNREKSLYTGLEIIKLKPDFVRIYPTLVVKDTFLERSYLNSNYLPMTLEEAVITSSQLLMMFTYNNIPAIRIGLQPTENIALGRDIIAGPFHPSFRQLVESEVYKIIFDLFFSDKSVNGKGLKIRISNMEISNLVGQRKENIKYLEEKYGFQKIRVIAQNIPKTHFYLEYDGCQFKINVLDFIKRYLITRNLISKVE